MSRSPLERIEAIEINQRMIYGQDRVIPDFKDFLRLLNSHNMRYLVVGEYAVGYYGYPRTTGDRTFGLKRAN